MLNKPPLFLQETENSCAVTCIRMVLAAFGIGRTEEELRRICDCGMEGTEALKLVDAARQLGLAGTRKYNLTMAELITEVKLGRFPIVYVRTRLDQNSRPSQHAYVIIVIGPDTITVLDPLKGEREIPLAEFEHDWRQMRSLTILCQK